MTSDALPDRKIGGLPGRPGGGTPDLRRLRKQNREQPPPTSPPLPPTPSPTTHAEVAETTPPASVETGGVRDQAPEATSTKRTTVYIGGDAFSRARGAYRATRTHENDRSWSDFVEKALDAEAVRRERLYNNGAPFGGVDSPLSPGRPINPE